MIQLTDTNKDTGYYIQLMTKDTGYKGQQRIQDIIPSKPR